MQKLVDTILGRQAGAGLPDREKLLLLLGSIVGVSITDRILTKQVNENFGSETFSYQNMADFVYQSKLTRKMAEMQTALISEAEEDLVNELAAKLGTETGSSLSDSQGMYL